MQVEQSHIYLAPEEFAEDLDLRLGRANGNIYQRRPGVEGVNDGQVMVRLKKKRFVILDYSIIPTDADREMAESNPHISIPGGAGRLSCTNADCNKVGVPVLLYDSDPGEPASLYMRSGLCFTCQRNLNEKRRTQRKRPGDASSMGISVDASGMIPGVFGSSSIAKRYKANEGAIVIHPVDGLRPHGDGYGFTEIGHDLQNILGDISNDTYRLLHAVGSTTEPPPPPPTNHHDIAATAAAVAASVGADGSNSLVATHVDDAATSAAMDAAASTTAAAAAAAAVAATDNDDKGNHEHDIVVHDEHQHHHHDDDDAHHVASVADSVPAEVPTTSDDINSLYDKAYRSMNKGIYLLCQWKQSWDSAIAAAVAQESVDNGLAEAVASAAAVAAASSDGHNGNVTSLLMAAGDGDEKKDEIKKEDEPDAPHAEHNIFQV